MKGSLLLRSYFNHWFCCRAAEIMAGGGDLVTTTFCIQRKVGLTDDQMKQNSCIGCMSRFGKAIAWDWR